MFPRKRKISDAVPSEAASPNKRPYTPRKKKQPIRTPEALWRQTNIREKTTITKTKAGQQYRLQNEDLARLEYIPHESVIGTEKHGDIIVPTYLYDEREVERVAWNKHGSPEAFEAYLQKLFDRHQNRNKKRKDAGESETNFEIPYTYSLEYTPFPGFKKPISKSPSKDQYVGSNATLLRCKQALQNDGREFLWISCNEILSNALQGRLTWKERAEYMTLAVQQLQPYPYRTPLAEDLTPSLAALKAVLDTAPRWSTFHHGSMIQYLNSKYWPEDLLQKLCGALIRVLKEDEYDGWNTARWMVYDKYSTTVYGVHIDLQNVTQWTDRAVFWLQESFPEKPELLCQGNPPESWNEYVDLVVKVVEERRKEEAEDAQLDGDEDVDAN